MMPPIRIIKVDTRAQATRLLETALRPGLKPEERQRAEELLRAANPHVNLKRVRPGTVIVVPDAPELRTDDTLALEAPVLGRKAEITARLQALFEQGNAALDRAAAERDLVVERLKSTAVRRVERGTDEDSATAKRLLTGVRDRLAAESKAAEQEREALKEQLDRGLKEIEELFGAFS